MANLVHLQAKDILGHVYEYFLGQFALAEGKRWSIFHAKIHCYPDCGNARTLFRASV